MSSNRAEAQQMRYGYDAVNNLTTVADDPGRAATNTDALNRITRVNDPAGKTCILYIAQM